MPALPRPLARTLYRTTVTAVGERAMFRRLSSLQERQWGPHEALVEAQRSGLRGLLDYAVSSIPYYKSRLASSLSGSDAFGDLASLPLLDKHDLQEHATELRPRQFNGRISAKTTGGSTGQPVTVYKDRMATAYERAAMWLAYGWFGVEMGDRGARFWGVPYSWRRRLTTRVADFCMNRIRFSAFQFDDDKLGDYWRSLCSFGPDYVHGYVSMLEQMARYALRERVTRNGLQLKSVIATSEVLTGPQRQVIEEAFGAPVQVEYGCGEVGPIAHECPAGSLHLASANLVVEVLRPDGRPAAPGETGEIVLTDLHNRAMPLIRYRVGDFGVRGSPCDCGRVFPVLEKVWGRAYDFVEDHTGRRYHGEFFMYVFEDLRSKGVPIGQFQVTQRDARHVVIRFTAEAELTASDREKVVLTVGERIPGVELDLEQVAAIPREPSGKMRVIRREEPAE